MTLKELSIQLYKPVHELANTLRQVGLADRLLSEDDILTAAQINRLRNGKTGNKPSSADKVKYKASSYAEPISYSIASLAKKYGRSVGEMVNNVKMSRLMGEKPLSPDSILPKAVWEEMESRLNDKRIRLRVLTDELGWNAKNLADLLLEYEFIPNNNWNQKIDESIERAIRNWNSVVFESEEELELRELHEYLDEVESSWYNFDYDDDIDENCDEDSEAINDVGDDDMEDEDSYEYWDEYSSYDDCNEQPEESIHTVYSLAYELGIAEERVINILKTYSDTLLAPASPIEDEISDRIISEITMIDRKDHLQSFENIYLLDRVCECWNNSVNPTNARYYKPGSEEEGEIWAINHDTRTITVRFRKITREDNFFIFKQIEVIRPERMGFVTFDEWDWELSDKYRELPDVGDKSKFMILSNDDGRPLELSRRQLQNPPQPDNGAGVVVAHHPDQELISVRHMNGSYGFISYRNLSDSEEFPILSPGTRIEMSLLRSHSQTVLGRNYYYAEYDVADNEFKSKREIYLRAQQGLSPFDICSSKTVISTDILPEPDDLWLYHSIFPARITTSNKGGYILRAILGEEEYELFCPFSKSPTWIDNTVHKSLIGTVWLVKIEKDPSEESSSNIIVSAKHSSASYEGLMEEGGFYEALICSCNESGANVLVENVVPMFIPNKYISFKIHNDARTDLFPGQKCIVKVISTAKGTCASIRDSYFDPWKRVDTKLPIGTVVQTEVLRRTPREIFVNLGEFIGRLPASEISWNDTKILDGNDVDLPDPLRVVVIGYQEESKKVEVSVRRLTVDPWEQPEKHLPEDRISYAEVTALSNRGAWLSVGEAGFKGYLSYRNVDWGKYVDKNNLPFSLGDKIDIKITRINKEDRQLTCSLKALKQNPWELLEGADTVVGTVFEINDDYAKVEIKGGIECTCHEALDSELIGRELEFRILQLNVAAQQIIISYRKKEIEELNTLAVGEMFKLYRHLDESEKILIPVSTEESEEAVYRDFIIKEVSSTGRVTAVYADDDEEYENGVLLPGAITIDNEHVNIIFARQIIKQYLRVGETYKFRVTHRYGAFNCAVLSLDVAGMLDLKHISTDDMVSMTSRGGVDAKVLFNICTERNVFVEWNGYFGYIPRSEIPVSDDDLPEMLRVKAFVMSSHPEQMMRFVPIDKDEETIEEEEREIEQNIAEKLEDDLYDCYQSINSLDGFNPNQPDYYPFTLQMRFDPGKHPELSELIAADPTYFSSQTFFLDCIKVKKGYILTVFSNLKSISAFCSEKEDGDEIRITKFIPNVMDSSEKTGHYSKPLRIAGENLQIVPLNSSALYPDHQDMDILMDLLKYNRAVLPKLRRLSYGDLQKRGEHYLTLQELLRMDLEREFKLCSDEITLKPSAILEKDGSLGGCAIEFDAVESAFDSITSKDDSAEGIKILIKPNDEDKLYDKFPSGVLRYIGTNRWVVELYADRDIEVENLKTQGIKIKRYPNIRHLNRQIIAIDNFVYERNGLDIFSKIARNKLKGITCHAVEDIEANSFFNLEDPNDSQANALKMAIGGSEISLIQGPPGTGKSTVIVDIIRNLVKQHKKVLVCTQSVAPVEELYCKVSGRRKGILIGDNVKVNGHPLRCAYLRDNDSLEISGGVQERRSALKDMRILADSLNRMNSSSDEHMSSKFQRAKASVESHHKEECSEVIRKFNNDLRPYYDGVENILSEYINALEREDVENFASEYKTLNLEAVDVVFGTCVGVGVSPYLRDVHFDALIIDEAGKANYAESLLPMMMADEYILVGDDKQLPPYTNSELVKELAQKRLLNAKQDAQDREVAPRTLENEINYIMEDVGKSLFGDLRPRLPESNQIMLSKQFRMHPEIGDFVSKLFYEGKVSSIPKPSDRNLNIEELETPIKFIDTSGMGSEARERRQGMSLYNDGEIQVIDEKLRPILQDAINAGKTVGILSPYGAQVIKMRQKFPELKNHIFTIDSIQGEEYDIVVFSFVRNTRSGTLNFVDDLRRLNVSFSRAKCNLIMIGHLDTLKNETLHKVDREAVIAVYDEIQRKKIELVVHHGAMQKLYDDFPPESCPVVKDLDNPYHVFEGCRLSHGGQFTGFYKGKLLTMFNPALRSVSTKDLSKEFRVALLGYRNRKPITMVEPMGMWLASENILKEFEFSAVVISSGQNNLKLELADKSIISLTAPNAFRFAVGITVKVALRNNKYIITIFENE